MQPPEFDKHSGACKPSRLQPVGSTAWLQWAKHGACLYVIIEMRDMLMSAANAKQ